MPVTQRSPYAAEWNAISKDGEQIIRELYPEEVIPMIAQGATPEELADHFSAPQEAIDHVIMCIPDMMAWRRAYGAVAVKEIGRQLPLSF